MSKYALCPFYRKEDHHKIYCEGICDGTSVHLVFDTLDRLCEYKKSYCYAGYSCCVLAQMLFAKYDGKA